jgi:hypothetical protein
MKAGGKVASLNLNFNLNLCFDMELLVIGLNHNTAPIEIRECLAFSEDKMEEALTKVHARRRFIQKKQPGAYDESPSDLHLALQAVGEVLRQFLGQNQGHDPILGAGQDQGGVADEVGPIPAVETHGRGRLAGKGVERLEVFHSNGHAAVNPIRVFPEEPLGDRKGHPLADDLLGSRPASFAISFHKSFVNSKYLGEPQEVAMSTSRSTKSG